MITTRKEAQEYGLQWLDQFVQTKCNGDENTVFIQSPKRGKCSWTCKEYREALEQDNCLEDSNINPVDEILKFEFYKTEVLHM